MAKNSGKNKIESAACCDVLRAHDRDRLIANLFAPQHHRFHLNALSAFAAELTSIRTKVSEPLLGVMRLQYWRDVLCSYNETMKTGNPLADALRQMLEETELTFTVIEQLIDNHESQLHDDRPLELSTYERRYAELEGWTIRQGARLILPGIILDEIANSAGVAIGMTRALTQCSPGNDEMRAFPIDILAIHGADQRSIGSNKLAAEAVLRDLISAVRYHLNKVRECARVIPVQVRPLLLPLAAVELDLRNLERYGWGVRTGNLRRQLAIYQSAWRTNV
jgi:phytoene synthase